MGSWQLWVPPRVAVCLAVALVVAVGGDSTATAAASPGGRVYELVSPIEKNGGEIMGDPRKTQAAVDGSAVSFSSLSGFGDTWGLGFCFSTWQIAVLADGRYIR